MALMCMYTLYTYTSMWYAMMCTHLAGCIFFLSYTTCVCIAGLRRPTQLNQPSAKIGRTTGNKVWPEAVCVWEKPNHEVSVDISISTKVSESICR